MPALPPPAVIAAVLLFAAGLYFLDEEMARWPWRVPPAWERWGRVWRRMR